MKNFIKSIPKEFLKIWIAVDYIVLLLLITVVIVGWFKGLEISSLVGVLVAWIAEIGLSTAAYAWKAKNENCIVNFLQRLIASVPEAYRDQIDITQILVAIINMPRT